jgi:hypothetical protein
MNKNCKRFNCKNWHYKVFLIFSISMLCHKAYSQEFKTFTDKSGEVFEIMEFKEKFTIDSCLIVEKQNIGWKVPDTAQFRNIHSQWFGKSNRHYFYPVGSSQAKVKQDIEGFSFLTSSKIDANFIKVEMRDQLYKLLAEEMNINSPAYYNLLLIRQKK